MPFGGELMSSRGFAPSYEADFAACRCSGYIASEEGQEPYDGPALFVSTLDFTLWQQPVPLKDSQDLNPFTENPINDAIISFN